jgi:peroxiredoxin Q/BCP
MSWLTLIKNVIAMMLRRPQMLEVGTEAPDFSVTAHDGSTVRLSDLRGKKVVLWFYPKANTGG